jgi:hypothetical protein
MPVTKSELQDDVFKETLANMRQMWGGDAAQGIKDLKIQPITVGSIKDRYMVTFLIDYGATGRPTGAPTHGSITLRQTPDGWKVGGFGSSIDPTLP